MPVEGDDGKPKPVSVAIIHNGKPLDELLNFPTKSTPEPEPVTADHGMKCRLNPFNGKLEWVPDDEPNDDDNVD